MKTSTYHHCMNKLKTDYLYLVRLRKNPCNYKTHYVMRISLPLDIWKCTRVLAPKCWFPEYTHGFFSDTSPVDPFSHHSFQKSGYKSFKKHKIRQKILKLLKNWIKSDLARFQLKQPKNQFSSGSLLSVAPSASNPSAVNSSSLKWIQWGWD